MKGLRVEELVRDEHAPGREVRLSSETKGAQFSKLPRDASVMRLAGLRADFHEGMRVEFADQRLRRARDQLAEHGPEGRGGGEVGPGGLADAYTIRRIIAETRRIQRHLDQPGERDHAVAGLATKQGDDGVMTGRGLHGRSVMRSFPLRQTNRD